MASNENINFPQPGQTGLVGYVKDGKFYPMGTTGGGVGTIPAYAYNTRAEYDAVKDTLPTPCLIIGLWEEAGGGNS